MAQELTSKSAVNKDLAYQAPKGHECFVHLRARSAYSLLEGAIKLDKLLALAIEDEQPALGLCDTNNLFGALEFSIKAAGKGLQPIIGVTLEVALEEEAGGEKSFKNDKQPQANLLGYPKLALLAMDDEGYENLLKLVSCAYLDVEDGARPHITKSLLERYHGGIILLSGGKDGPIDFALHQDQKELAEQRIDTLYKIFQDRFYIELQRPDNYNVHVEKSLLNFAYNKNIPIVATNEIYFAKAEDYEAHDALIAIAEGRMVVEEDRRKLTPSHHMKSRKEMMSLFKDLPEAIENTIEIAKRCAVKVETKAPILPSFTALDAENKDISPEETSKVEFEALKQQAEEGLKARLDVLGVYEGYTQEDYEERLKFELKIIQDMGFPGYFLIVADFISWAKEQDIPVGPGRGSGAGSLVAWALTITDLDPMRFSLLFERFLNPERVSMPDFDIDFCQDRRGEVIRYVQQKYGAEQVAQIITFGSLQARAVLRDVGRVLQMPYGQVDRLCKMVPSNPANPTSLKDAIKEEPRFQEAVDEDAVVGKLLDIALKLEGLYRHASTHAAGIVIGDRPLDKLVPLFRDPRSDMPVTQFNMKWVESAGLVKFDFLGLKTLTVLSTAVKYVKQRNIDLDISQISLEDEATYELLQRGETVGVFQLESAGMRKAVLGMKPDRLEDIIALVALYRPGPMENIPTYNARKHGEEEPDYYHDKIEGVLKETHGVIIYQEQVMQIAQILSGYSLGEADLLRRAMGKKIREEMDKQRVRFVDGAVENGLKKDQANMIFDLLAKFADYGFNKSHAAAYALVSYQTAYMKANYAVEFMAACMTLDMGNTDKLNEYYRDAKRAEIEIVAPSINTSYADFAVKDGKVFYSLAAIKGVGEQAIEHLVEVRQKDGVYKSIDDFFSRIDPKQINRKAIENMICAGAFDEFKVPREQLLNGLDMLVGHASRTARDRDIGAIDMFGGGSDESKIKLPDVPPWTASEKLLREYQAVGFYLSAHPLDEYHGVLEKMRVQTWRKFERAIASGASAGRLAGTVIAKQERKTKKGKPMGIVALSDSTGQFEVVLFSESLTAFRDKLEVGQSVVILVKASQWNDDVSLQVQSVNSLESEAQKVQKAMRIYLRDDKPIPSIAQHLKQNGDGNVSLIVVQNSGEREVEIDLGRQYSISPQVASALKTINGIVDVELL